MLGSSSYKTVPASRNDAHHRRKSTTDTFTIELQSPSPSNSISSVPSPTSRNRRVLDKLVIRSPRYNEPLLYSKRTGTTGLRSWTAYVSSILLLLVLFRLRESIISTITSPVSTLALPTQPVCDDVAVPCRFLLLSRVCEQESKSQRHLYQLSMLSARLNRTLVLPNVKNGRLSACLGKPFSLYYEERSGWFPSPTIPHGLFLQWAEKTIQPPSSEVVLLARSPPNPAPSQCVGAVRLAPPLKTSSVAVPEGPGRTYAKSQAFIESLVDDLGKSEADVIIVNHDLRHPLFPVTDSLAADAAYIPLPYSSSLVARAAQIATSLSPYVAVHWRTELVPIETLSPCADGLVETLRKLKRAFPELRSLYLATDYSLNSDKPHSGTFRPVEGTAEVFQHLMDELGTIEGLQVRTSDPHGVLAKEDSALPGLVDKMVASRAELFLAGAFGKQPMACGKISSFTAQIVGERQRSARQLWNTVETWGPMTASRDEEI